MGRIDFDVTTDQLKNQRFSKELTVCIATLQKLCKNNDLQCCNVICENDNITTLWPAVLK